MKRRLFALCAVMCGGVVNAQPLDDIRLQYQDQSIVATINLTGPVQYLRHFPESHGKTLEIYFDRVKGATTDETWVDNEVRHSPPSSLIPGFTVTTRDQATNPRLVIEFEREAEYSVSPGKDNRSLLITIRPDKKPVSTGPLPFLPAIKPEVAVAAGAALTADEAAIAETNKQARELLVQGREALAAKKDTAAVDALNKLLLLPPNDFTQDAQEWVGVARERAGQFDKAKTEYDLYLRLYPDGDGAARVAQRLAGLGQVAAPAVVAEKGEEKKKAARWMSFGSVSSRYYFGNTKIDSTSTFNNATTTSSLSMTDQSMLISTVDASERYISDEYDARIVFRDANTKNFLSSQPSLNRVNAAYGEIKSRTQDYLVRVGRQSSSGGGVMGRFDGMSASYGDAQELRVNGVVGSLADYSIGKATKPFFFGAGYDFGPYSIYAINQSADGVLDRRAVGAQWRYFDNKTTAFALLDYDTYFKALNAVQLMGTYSVMGSTLNFMVDRRRTPSLSIRNALNGSSTSSVNALLQTMSASSLKDLALARTATSNMAQAGISIPFMQKWQIGGDLRLSNTTGLAASGTHALEGILAATPGRGLERGVSGNIIGSNLYKDGDIWSANTSFTTGNSVSGHSIFLYNHIPLKSNWMMDASLQLYNQTDQFGGTTKRTSPMLRGSYRIRDMITFDADAGYESANYNGPNQAVKTTRFFYSVGLRGDF